MRFKNIDKILIARALIIYMIFALGFFLQAANGQHIAAATDASAAEHSAQADVCFTNGAETDVTTTRSLYLAPYAEKSSGY